MLKNILQIVKAIVCCTIITVSPYVCAETISIPVELTCSPNPMVATRVEFPGELGVRYTLITDGLRKNEGVVEVIRPGTKTKRTRDSSGTSVYVEARCIPSDVEAEMSSTGSSLGCSIGEGIEVLMLEPNSSDPNAYRYVGTLFKTKNEEKTQATMVGDVFTVDNINKIVDGLRLDVPKTRGMEFGFLSTGF